jgi:hypothetical protein
MPNPMIRIHDVENDTIVDREMTADEFKAHKVNAAALKALEDANKVTEEVVSLA